MRNIYERKNYKLYIIIPIALLLVSLVFIPRIQLDQSLRGGVNIQLQTNSSIDVRTLSAAIDAAIPRAQSSISLSPGGISITMATNSSLSSASTLGLAVYAGYSNYSNSALLLAAYKTQLQSQPNNQTLISTINSEQANQTKELAQMSTSLSQELALLVPFVGGPASFNSTNPSQMVSVAQTSLSAASAAYQSKVIATLHSLLSFTTYSYNDITATLGSFFLSQMEAIIIAAFVIVAIAVFIIFRSPVPALAVVFSSANDILVALGVMAIVGIPLGVASIGGILMLIGYSIDTALLSSIRILKRSEGTATERAFSTFKTGITMTSAAIITFSVLLVVAYIAFIPTYIEISGVVLAGLVADIFTTWFGNTPMVLAYKKRKEYRGPA